MEKIFCKQQIPSQKKKKKTLKQTSKFLEKISQQHFFLGMFNPGHTKKTGFKSVITGSIEQEHWLKMADKI